MNHRISRQVLDCGDGAREVTALALAETEIKIPTLAADTAIPTQSGDSEDSVAAVQDAGAPTRFALGPWSRGGLKRAFRLPMKPAFSCFLVCFCVMAGSRILARDTEANSVDINHTFLATGAETRIVSGNGQTIWQYPRGTRDGWVLSNGNILLAVSKDNDYPGGAVVEVTRAGKTVFEWKGTQSEVNTAQALPNGNILLTEAGAKPRLLEVNREGKIIIDVSLTCQNTNAHMESRMARKLPNGNYLVPQLLDKVVREYNPVGKIVWEVKTPHWPFTAIRLPNGNTLINCTYGNVSIEVDNSGKTVWEFSNLDLPEPLLKDACGGQRLPNGNTVICAYGIGARRTKLLEVTPDKKVVWTYTDDRPHGIHEVQILDTNGKRLEGTPLR